MQVLDYRHSEPTPSPPHNTSWLLDNQPTASPVPQPSSSPPHRSIPLAPSNSLTGISNQQHPPPSTPLHTSSSSALHTLSHPSHASSDVYPSQHPSAPRDTPPLQISRLSALTPQHNLNINTASANQSNTHSSLAKFGNLLNVSNAAIEHARESNQVELSYSVSNQPEIKDIPPHSYPSINTSLSAPLEYRQSANDPYQPMHRPQFPPQTCTPVFSGHRYDHVDAQQANAYHQEYVRENMNSYDNTCSLPYPGTAPMTLFKERRYGIPKFNGAIVSEGVGLCQLGAPSVPVFKQVPHDLEPVSNAMCSRSQSPAPANGVQTPRNLEEKDFVVGGSLLRDTIEAFQSKGMNEDRAEFIRDYMALMQAYEGRCDVIYDATERTCMELMLKSRVPLLEDSVTAPVDDETPEDARQKLVVKKKFVEAMEALQGDQLPTKRRGNLPKECTEYLKKWFDDHYDHPYPTDDEKLEMSKRTKIGMSQISHWFINYRKRVWKPSLPPNHPALSGDHCKKARKKPKTGDEVYK